MIDVEEIEMTITKGDRVEAGPFSDIHGCLLATMFKRRGFDVESASACTIRLPGNCIYLTATSIIDLYRYWPFSPFGRKVKWSAVGKKIIFRRV